MWIKMKGEFNCFWIYQPHNQLYHIGSTDKPIDLLREKDHAALPTDERVTDPLENSIFAIRGDEQL